MRSRFQRRRRGAILPLFVFCLTAIVGMLALGIDLGLLALARSHCQAAADAAALAGVRRLNGDYTAGNNGNYDEVQAAATAAIQNNRILSKFVFDNNPEIVPPAAAEPLGTLTTSIGTYSYNSTQQKFSANYSNPGPAPSYDGNGQLIPWSLVKAQVDFKVNAAFGKMLGYGTRTVTTVAVAAHRPRDVAIVMDSSGSMGFDSTLGVRWGNGSRTRVNNPDRAYPRFGAYAHAVANQNGVNANAYDLYQLNTPNPISGDRDYNVSNFTVNPSNVSSAYLDADPIVLDFYTGASGALTRAWPASEFPSVSSDSYTPSGVTPGTDNSSNEFQDLPGGDQPPVSATTSGLETGSSYAKHVTDLTQASSPTTRRGLNTSTSDADFEVFGYSHFGNPVAGKNTSYNTAPTKLSDAVYKLSALTGRTNYEYAGFQQGPRYWGKTFFQWPADPRRPITSTARLTWNGSAWVAPTTLGVLNKWLIDLDRNWMLLPSGARPTSGGSVYGGVAGLTRYAAGAYDPLLNNWPLDANGNLKASYWSRAQVERFLRGMNVTTGVDLRPSYAHPTSYNLVGTATTPSAETYSTSNYRATPTLQNGADWYYGTGSAAFWLGVVVDRSTGAPLANTAANYPRLDHAALGNWTKTNLLVEGANNGTLSGIVAPSPMLLGAFEPMPTAKHTWATTPTQAEIDGQIARLILGLYDNIEASYDWRTRYFTAPTATSAWPNNATMYASKAVDSYTGFFMSTPVVNTSTTSYHINYAAILNWIKNVGPNPFPPSLKCGRIVYYTSIPNSITLPTPTNADEVFWKYYIDYVLGYRMSGTTYTDYHNSMGYGRDFDFNGSSVSAKPTDASAVQIRYNNSSNTQANLVSNPRLAPYQNYNDSPMRPKTRMWFGPMTLVDFLLNNNMGNPLGSSYVGTLCPGACSQSQAIACKLGIRAALLDSKINHPNDLASLIFFSGSDMTSCTPDRYRVARAPLGNNYDTMIEYLFFPPATIASATPEIAWNNSAINETPSANGGTCYDLPLMLAYNQFSANSSLLTANAGWANGNAGGLGRMTAQKMVIFETDGVANTKCDIPTLSGTTNGQKYYNVRATDAVTLTSAAWNLTNLSTLAAKIGSPLSSGGYSTTTKPALVHAVGFGFLFEPGFTNVSETNGALGAMTALQTGGNVNDNDGYTPLYGSSQIAQYKIITGNSATRIEKLRNAFTKILQESTVTVSLID